MTRRSTIGIRVAAVAAIAFLGGCGDAIEPITEGLPAELGMSFAIIGEAASVAGVFDKADNLEVTVAMQDREPVTRTFQIASGQSTIEARMQLTLEQASAVAEVHVELKLGDTPLFAGSETITLEQGEQQQLAVDLSAVPAELLVPSELTMVTGEEAQLSAEVRFATGDEIPGAPVAWTATGEGISVSDDGLVRALATGNFQIEGRSGELAKTLSVAVHDPLQVTTTSLPEGTVDQAYSAQLEASGGDGSYGWSLSSGTLPDGLSLGSSGAISGTPATGGAFEFTLQVSSAGQSTTADLSVTVHDLQITTTSLPDGTVGQVYSAQLEASGGDGSYVWSLSSGSLPDGLSLSSSGGISGTPPTAGSSGFTVQVSSAGQSTSRNLSITVIDPDNFNCNLQSEIPVPECEALVALYNSTDGSSWTDSGDWLSTNSPCSWVGVACAGGGVVRLHLRENDLTGSIPAELGNLSKLTLLVLYGNQLTGSIPAELGNLVQLTELSLQTNQLTGSIPAELGNLVQLTVLSLQNNQLTGSIPAELGNLSNLNSLWLYGNQLTGSIPAELGTLSGLTRLHLGNNQLTGSIPTELGNLPNLVRLILPANQLTGSIPAELGNLSNLTDLYLSFNQLTGPIPAELGNLSDLGQLVLRDNQLDGSIPATLGNLASLTFLDLAQNQLTGSIPSELGNLSSLIRLRLNINQLTGPIPASLGNMTSLESMDLYQNQLSGPIPAELGNLPNLTRLVLAFNQLTGSIPAELGNLTALFGFALNDNQLTGQVPLEVAILGGQIDFSGQSGTFCWFHENASLSMPNTQEYQDADLNEDGEICRITLGG